MRRDLGAGPRDFGCTLCVSACMLVLRCRIGNTELSPIENIVPNCPEFKFNKISPLGRLESGFPLRSLGLSQVFSNEEDYSSDVRLIKI